MARTRLGVQIRGGGGPIGGSRGRDATPSAQEMTRLTDWLFVQCSKAQNTHRHRNVYILDQSVYL